MKKHFSLIYKNQKWFEINEDIGFDKQIMQENQGKIFGIILNVYQGNFNEDWHSRIWISKSEKKLGEASSTRQSSEET